MKKPARIPVYVQCSFAARDAGLAEDPRTIAVLLYGPVEHDEFPETKQTPHSVVWVPYPWSDIPWPAEWKREMREEALAAVGHTRLDLRYFCVLNIFPEGFRVTLGAWPVGPRPPGC